MPRGLSLKQPAIELALGKDHAIILTENSTLYSLGSNQYGQLGIEFPEVEMAMGKKGQQAKGQPMNESKKFAKFESEGDGEGKESKLIQL